MKLELSTAWIAALVVFGLAGLVGGILGLVYQFSTSGNLALTNSAGDAITNSPFAGAKIDYTTGKGSGLFAGAILALVGGFAVVAILGASYLKRDKSSEVAAQ